MGGGITMPGDPSSLDDERVKDVMLYVEFKLAT